MRDNWTEVGISDLLEVSIGGVWGGDPGTDEIDVCVYRQTEFDDNGTLSMPSDAVRSITKNQLKSRTLQPGDVLMQKSAGTPTLPGRVVIVPSEIERNATCSNFLHLLRADSARCNSHFLFWFLWFNHQSGKAFEFQRGTNIKNLDLNQYLAQQVLLPPLDEQKRIVDVVSSVDAYIDALQQQAGTALKARNAVLHELLSAGGDDWTDTTLGDIAKFVRGPFGGSLKKEIFVQSGFAVYEQQHAIYGDFVNFRYFVNKEKFDEMKRFSVSTGDLLMSCSGTVGKVSLVPPDAPAGIINQALLKISTSSQVSSAFLLYWTQSEIFRLLIQENSGGAVQQNVASVKLLKDIRITLPPIDEQKRIVEIVSSMDEVIHSTEQAVVDAKNLRSGLLSDLLSGEHEIPASYDSLLGAA